MIYKLLISSQSENGKNNDIILSILKFLNCALIWDKNLINPVRKKNKTKKDIRTWKAAVVSGQYRTNFKTERMLK